MRRAGGALGAIGAAVALVRLLGGPFDEVRSSTGAWLLAHVERVLLVGDFRDGATASEIPNVAYDPLFPAAIAAPGWFGGNVVVIGHVVAAGSLGLLALGLGSLWRQARGPAAAWAGASAVLLPPVVATASLARYDVPAMALAVGAAACAARGTTGAWALAGVFAGAAHLTREFLVIPALGAMIAAWLAAFASLPGRRRGRELRSTLLPRAALALATGIAVALALPLALGLSPVAGVEALLSYGGRRGPDRFGLVEILGLPAMALPGAVGLAGLLFAAKGCPHLPAFAALWGLLLSHLAFAASAQQSPQYYLLALLVLTSGVAGLVRRAREAVLPAAALLAWAAFVAPEIASGRLSAKASFHSESWPAPPAEIAAQADWLVAQAGSRPLFVVSEYIENFDALVEIRHGRPVAHLFSNELGRIDDASVDYGVDSVLLAVIDREERPPPPGATLIAANGGTELTAWLYERPLGLPHFRNACGRFRLSRGACRQVDWLRGGREEMADGIRRRSSTFARFLGFRW